MASFSSTTARSPWPPPPTPLLQRIGSVDNVGLFLEGVKNRKERMFGFGHRCGMAQWGPRHRSLPCPAAWLQPGCAPAARPSPKPGPRPAWRGPLHSPSPPRPCPTPPHPTTPTPITRPVLRRIYKNYDPRAKIIRQVAEEVFQIAGRDPLIDVALALEAAAHSDEYFVQRRLYPNVDFFSGKWVGGWGWGWGWSWG